MSAGHDDRDSPGHDDRDRAGHGHRDDEMVAGRADPRFDAVRDTFAEIIAAQTRDGGNGAALCVYIDGRPVIDLYGGWMDRIGHRTWGPETIVQPYSVSKPLAAICALRLIDRGEMDLDAPVQRYWPEMVAETTVRQILSHQSGLVALDEPCPTAAWFDWDRICKLLAAQKPEWPPGTALGESALFYGHLVGELVRRVDGRRVGAFLHEEVCQPHGIDFHFGLGDEAISRTADLTLLDRIPGQGSPGQGSPGQGSPGQGSPGQPELYRRAVSNPPGHSDPEVVNSSAWRRAEIPAINGHGSARGLARFYRSLIDGKVVSRDLLKEATRSQCAGPDLVFGGQNSWGLGFGLDDDGFGMGGLGGSYAGVSTRGGYVIAFVTAAMGTHDRVTHLENAVREVIGLAPLQP